VTGSAPFSLEISDCFKRTLKKLGKAYRDSFIENISNRLEGLILDPYPPEASDEPLPSKMQKSNGWTFHKLRFKIGKGSSGLIRLMYLVNEEERRIKPLWIYSHEQFEKRPPDKELRAAILELLSD
jgi:mRNA-degrading endonuclease RelE of RelBE toxin-antitoxin system